MSVFKWIRDLQGIRKDRIETKKDQLEIKRLQKEIGEKVEIKKASLEDIKKYDPKMEKLHTAIRRQMEYKSRDEMHFRKRKRRIMPIIIAVILVIIFIFIFLKMKKFF